MLTPEPPATTAAAEWRDPEEATGLTFRLDGTERLLFAVLEDAFRPFRRYVIASGRRGDALFSDLAASTSGRMPTSASTRDTTGPATRDGFCACARCKNARRRIDANA